MNRNANLSLGKLSFAGTPVHWYTEVFGAVGIIFELKKLKKAEGSGEFQRQTFRKGVGSGDAVERSCGWEEEMREELRKDWSERNIPIFGRIGEIFPNLI